MSPVEGGVRRSSAAGKTGSCRGPRPGPWGPEAWKWGAPDRRRGPRRGKARRARLSRVGRAGGWTRLPAVAVSKSGRSSTNRPGSARHTCTSGRGIRRRSAASRPRPRWRHRPASRAQPRTRAASCSGAIVHVVAGDTCRVVVAVGSRGGGSVREWSNPHLSSKSIKPMSRGRKIRGVRPTEAIRPVFGPGSPGNLL
jgi:hypothetical protein